MLESIHATRFVRQMTTGRNCPVLVEAERRDGEFIEVVVKLASAECGLGGLVREAICSMLAADLNLPVAEPFVVEFDQHFIDSVPTPEARGKFEAGLAGFGCKHVAGMHTYPPEQALPLDLMNTASEIFAFDGGVLNPDRLRIRPNCLTDGRALLLIDHESALNVYGRGFLVTDPWKTGALKPLTEGSTEHLFYRTLHGEQHSSSQLIDALAVLRTSRIDSYMQAVPATWDQDWSIRTDIATYLKDLVVNTQHLNAELASELQ